MIELATGLVAAVLRPVVSPTTRYTFAVAFVLRNLGQPPTDVFSGAWKIVDGQTSRRPIKGRLGVPPRHIRHFRLRQLIKLIIPRYAPTVTCDPEVVERMRRASEKGKDAALEEGILIAREMFERVRPHVQGIQVSAPFGRIPLALRVFEGIPGIDAAMAQGGEEAEPGDDAGVQQP